MPIFKALVITEHKQKTPLTIIDYEEPTLGEGEFLLENVAVAQNPVDWKQIDGDFGIPSLPWVVGGDGAGTIYKVGPGVTKFKVGDRVITFFSRKTARHSAYQTYSIGDVDRTVKLPESYSFESGSTIPLAYVTAGAGLEHGLKVKLPSPEGPLPVENPSGEPLLVWGGSSSVGAYVIQLAKYAGYKVITTASKSNHAYVKSLGADYIFDYHDADVVDQIRNAAGPNLSLVYDTISYESTVKPSSASITSPSGGTVTVILPGLEGLSTDKVKVVQTGAVQATNNPEIGKVVYGVLAAALEKGIFIPNKVKIIPGGLVGVNEGLALGRADKVSGEKLVYRIAETPF